MTSPNEQELIEGAQAYDPSALTVIYQTYSPGIYRYAIRLLGDDCLAEDCVSETFSRFLKMLRIGQGPRDHLQAYLYRVAHNWITDSYRRQPPPAMELDESIPDIGFLSPEKDFENNHERNQVRMALRSLTPDQHMVVTLRFIEGWDPEEVAIAMQKPAGAVRALQFRALNTLRRLLHLKEGLYETKSTC